MAIQRQEAPKRRITLNQFCVLRFGLENLQGKDAQLRASRADSTLLWRDTSSSHLDASAGDVAATASGALVIPICTARMKTPSPKDTCEVILGWRNWPCRSAGKLRFSQQLWSCNHLVGFDLLFTCVQLAWINASMRTQSRALSSSSDQTTLSRTLTYVLLSWKRGDLWWA